MAADEHTVQDLADLTERWSLAAQAYLDGDLPRYAALANHAPDFTLTPPLGGDPREGFDGSDQAVESTAKTFRGETRASRSSRRTPRVISRSWSPPSDSMALSSTYRARSGRCASPSSSAGTVTSGSCCTGTPTRSLAPSPSSSLRRLREESMPRAEIHPLGCTADDPPPNRLRYRSNVAESRIKTRCLPVVGDNGCSGMFSAGVVRVHDQRAGARHSGRSAAGTGPRLCLFNWQAPRGSDAPQETEE